MFSAPCHAEIFIDYFYFFVNGNIFLDMLQQWLMTQVKKDYGNEFILQLDGAPFHFNKSLVPSSKKIYPTDGLDVPLQMICIFIIDHLGHQT